MNWQISAGYDFFSIAWSLPLSANFHLALFLQTVISKQLLSHSATANTHSAAKGMYDSRGRIFFLAAFLNIWTIIFLGLFFLVV
jgi:hypothetical protein